MGDLRGFLLRQLKSQGELLGQALTQLDEEVSAHNKLKYAVMAIGGKGDTCWCRCRQRDPHSANCNAVYSALYGRAR